MEGGCSGTPGLGGIVIPAPQSVCVPGGPELLCSGPAARSEGLQLCTHGAWLVRVGHDPVLGPWGSGRA